MPMSDSLKGFSPKTTSLVRSTLLALQRTSTLRHDEYGQETLLNLLLRNYLHFNLYDQVGHHWLFMCLITWQALCLRQDVSHVHASAFQHLLYKCSMQTYMRSMQCNGCRACKSLC